MIRLENVSKRYQMGGVRVTALENVCLEIGSGEFVVVVGPSGSGKTTLLNIIGALDIATEGRSLCAVSETAHVPLNLAIYTLSQSKDRPTPTSTWIALQETNAMIF